MGLSGITKSDDAFDTVGGTLEHIFKRSGRFFCRVCNATLDLSKIPNNATQYALKCPNSKCNVMHQLDAGNLLLIALIERDRLNAANYSNRK